MIARERRRRGGTVKFASVHPRPKPVVLPLYSTRDFYFFYLPAEHGGIRYNEQTQSDKLQTALQVLQVQTEHESETMSNLHPPI